MRNVRQTYASVRERVRRNALLREIGAGEDRLGLRETVHLRLAVALALLEVLHHVVAAIRDRLEERQRSSRSVLVGRARGLLTRLRALVRRDGAVQGPLRGLEILDGLRDVRGQGRVRRDGILLVLVGLGDVLLHVVLHVLHHRDHAASLRARTAVPVRAPGGRRRGRRLATLTGRLHEGQAVVRVEVLEHLHRGPKHLNRLLVVGLRSRVLAGLLRALVVRVLLGLVQVGDLVVALLDALVRRGDLLVQAIDRLRARVDLLRELVELVVVLRALALAHLLLRRVVLLLLRQVRKHVLEALGHRREVRRGLLGHLARERDEAEVPGLDARAAEHARGRLRLRGAVLAHRAEVRLEEGRALRVEAALEEVPSVVGGERRDGLLDARLLLRAQALALRPLRSLSVAGRLGLGDELLVVGVLRLKLRLLGRALRHARAAGAVLTGLREQRILRRRELVVLRGHERREVGHSLVLRRHGLVAVVREGREHLPEDLLDLTRPLLVLHLEGRIAVELVPVRVRHVQHLAETLHVRLGQEALANLDDLLHLGVHRGEEHTLLHRRSRVAHGIHGALESGNRLVELVLRGEVVRMLLVPHVLLVLDSLLELLDLRLERRALGRELHAPAGKVVDVRRELTSELSVLVDRLGLAAHNLLAPALETIVQVLLGLEVRLDLGGQTFQELRHARDRVQLLSSCQSEHGKEESPHHSAMHARLFSADRL